MAINALIAQGVRPVGADLPEIANMLQQKKQQTFQNALSTEQNDRAKQTFKVAMDNESEAKKTADAKRGYAAAQWLKKVPPENLAEAINSDPYVSANLQKNGIDPRTTEPTRLMEIVNNLERVTATYLGQGPTQPQLVQTPTGGTTSLYNPDSQTVTPLVTGQIRPPTVTTDNALINIVDEKSPNGYKTIRRSDFAPGMQEWQKPTGTSGSGGNTPADIEQGLRDRAQMIANYEIAPPSGFGSNNPNMQKLYSYIKEVNPKFDAKNYSLYSRGRGEFTSGMSGRMIQSFNTSLEHMNALEPLIEAMKNNDWNSFNRIANAVGVETGGVNVTNFNMGKDILGTEIEKALIANGGTGGERTEAKNRLNAARSPDQLLGGIGVAKKFFAGQLKSLRQRGTAATGWSPEEFDRQLLLPNSQEQMNKLDNGIPPDIQQMIDSAKQEGK